MLSATTGQPCSGTAGSSTVSNQHLVGSSSKIRLFCSSCNQEFSSTSELNEHMERHNLEIEEALLRDTGMPVSAIMSSSRSSTTQQRGLSSQLHSCMYCGMQFRDQNSFMSHQKRYIAHITLFLFRLQFRISKNTV